MKTPSNLDRHLQLQLPVALHHNMEEKAYKCPYSSCQFSTKHKYNLKRHEIVHTKEKRFPCTVCTYRAGTKVTLQKHLRGHEGGNNKSYASSSSSTSAPISHHQHHGQQHQQQHPHHQQHQQQQHTANHRHGSKVPSSSGSAALSAQHHHHHHQQQQLDSADRPFMCHMCNYKGKLKSHLTRHLSMKSHNNGRHEQEPQQQQQHQQQQQQQVQQVQQVQQIQQHIQVPQLLQNTLQNDYKNLSLPTTSSLTVQAGSFAGFSPTLFKVPYYYGQLNFGGKPYS